MVVAAQHEVRNPPPPGAAPPHRHLTPAERESVNLQIIRRGENLMSQVFQNNTWENATGWAAEQFLRGLTLGTWGGTGLSQLPQWQRDVEARRRIVGPEYPADRVTPEDWRNLYADVMGRTDERGRRWGNCGEMAGSLAHIIHGMINDATRYPNMAGMQVRQAFGSNPGHSWVEVRDSRGQITVYDPWARVTGPLEGMAESYRRQNIAYTPWFGRRP